MCIERVGRFSLPCHTRFCWFALTYSVYLNAQERILTMHLDSVSVWAVATYLALFIHRGLDRDYLASLYGQPSLDPPPH